MTFQESVIKLADNYIACVLTLLQQKDIDPVAVHDIRVFMKRLRGLLRLYATAGQSEEARLINPVLRDVAKAFAAQRDSHVLADTLQQLATGADPDVATRLLAIRDELLSQVDAAQHKLDLNWMLNDLGKVRLQWKSFFAWQKDERLLDALAHSYRRNRKQGREALRLRDKTVLHDWRKRVKYFHYQLCALVESSSGFDADLEDTRKLGSLLGKVHDLDVLVEYLKARGQDDKSILRVLAKRRVRLVQEIRDLYDEIFSSSTGAFRSRIEPA